MAGLIDHLWQSTWFVCMAALLAGCLRSAPASVRYSVWLAASLKFLVPFAVFSWIGRWFVWRTADDTMLLPLVQYASTTHVSLPSAFIGAVLVLWAVVAAALIVRLSIAWLRCRVLSRRGVPYASHLGLEIRLSHEIDVPSLIGVLRPVLVLPTRLLHDCTLEQIAAIVAHERCHARRRDNLAAWCHACVEAIFWFHPMVWWIGRKLLTERELACDEAVIHEGHETHSYASALIVASRHACRRAPSYAAAATGGDLVRRIRAILTPARARVTLPHRLMIAAAMILCMSLPVASGMTIVSTHGIHVNAGARVIEVSRAREPAFVVMEKDFLYARNVSLRQLISDVYAVNLRNVSGSEQWLDRSRYDIELAAAADASMDARALVADLLRQRFNIDLIVRPALTAESVH